MLTESEMQRYRRQIILPEWGESGQERMKQARVVVAGAGGLGCSVLTYLAAAGVGNIRIVDGDKVELGNLNRQVLYSEEDIGSAKVNIAGDRLRWLNPDIEIEALEKVIDEENVFELVGDWPIVDAMDNLEARLLLNNAALYAGTPLFHGAIHGFEGRATTVIPGQTPCLACLYQGSLAGELPVLGAIPGIIGCIQATEVIKYFLNIGDLLLGRLFTYDGLKQKSGEIRLKRDPGCKECGWV